MSAISAVEHIHSWPQAIALCVIAIAASVPVSIFIYLTFKDN